MLVCKAIASGHVLLQHQCAVFVIMFVRIRTCTHLLQRLHAFSGGQYNSKNGVDWKLNKCVLMFFLEAKMGSK